MPRRRSTSPSQAPQFATQALRTQFAEATQLAEATQHVQALSVLPVPQALSVTLGWFFGTCAVYLATLARTDAQFAEATQGAAPQPPLYDVGHALVPFRVELQAATDVFATAVIAGTAAYLLWRGRRGDAASELALRWGLSDIALGKLISASLHR